MVEFQTVWGWQPALYLFLGGVGAGALVFSAVLLFVGKKRQSLTVGLSLWVGALCMIIGLLLLLSELTDPERGMLAWQSFVNLTSWMTYGAWGVIAAIAVAILAALCITPGTAIRIAGVWKGFFSAQGGICSVLVAIGAALGLFVAVYTGVLLMSAPGIPFWDTPLLPCLFAISAFDTGIALVEIVSVLVRRREKVTAKCSALLERSVVVLVILEAVLLAVFLFTMNTGNGSPAESASAIAAAASVNAIIAGSFAPYFWCLVVGCGLVAPLVASVLSLKLHGRNVGTLVLAGAAGALIGGCALRFLVLMAGAHADFVADTIALLPL